MRTNFDFTPYRRSTVGFGRLFNLLEAGAREDDGYPLFDIVKLGDDSFRITLAIAGFRPDDIEIVAQQNQLTVTGKRADDRSEEHTSELQSLMRISYAVFCLQKKNNHNRNHNLIILL